MRTIKFSSFKEWIYFRNKISFGFCFYSVKLAEKVKTDIDLNTENAAGQGVCSKIGLLSSKSVLRVIRKLQKPL